MSSKSRGGLSKREYAAQQAAKKVSSTKISAAPSRPTTTSSFGQSSNPSPFKGLFSESNTLQGALNSVGATEQSKGFEKSYANPEAEAYAKSVGRGSDFKPKKKSSPKPSTQREQAANAFNNQKLMPAPTGIGAAIGNAVSGVKNFVGGLFDMGDYGKLLGNNASLLGSSNRNLTDEQRGNNLAALERNTLGLSGASANVGTIENQGRGINPGQDQPTGYGPNGEEYFNGYNPARDGASIFKSDFATPGTNFSRPGSEQAFLNGQSPIAFGNQQKTDQEAYGSSPTPKNETKRQTPKPTPVSNPFQKPTLSDVFTPDKNTSIDPQLDLTQVVNNPGTTRRFLGNGYLSNGVASNGKGNYGLEGASTGTEEGGILDELKSLLGNTAHAAEMPQQPMGIFNQSPLQMMGGQKQNPYQHPSIQGADMADPFGMMQKEEPAPKPKQQASFTGGGMQAPKSNAVSMYEQSIQGYDKQAKETKRALAAALKDMLAGIDMEYNQSQQEGTTALDKQKNEDLLKLSGLFNFANQDPNSEQRIQYQQRTNDDYAGQLSNLIAKLNAAKSRDVLNAKSGIADKQSSALSAIQSAKIGAQQNLAQLLDSIASRSRSGSNTQNTRIQELLNRAANMPQGGREYAQQQADMLGLGDISGYTPNGWENAYNPNFGQSSLTKSQNPFPKLSQDGKVYDGNPYSPTYGMEMEQQ